MPDVFAAVADTTRRQILERLRTEGPVSISTLSDGLPMTRQAVTKHLTLDLPRIGGRLSACVFSLLPRAFGVRSFRCAGGAGE